MNWWCWVPNTKRKRPTLLLPCCSVASTLLSMCHFWGNPLNGISPIACMADEPNIPRILILGKS